MNGSRAVSYTHLGFQSRTYRAILSDSASPLWADWEALYADLADPKRERTAHAFFYRHRKEMLTGARVLWPEKLSYYDLRVMRLAEGASAFPVSYTPLCVGHLARVRAVALEPAALAGQGHTARVVRRLVQHIALERLEIGVDLSLIHI